MAKSVPKKKRLNEIVVNVDAERICEHCNKTFPLASDHPIDTEKYYTIQKCPHCGKRNDIWVNVKVKLS